MNRKLKVVTIDQHNTLINKINEYCKLDPSEQERIFSQVAIKEQMKEWEVLFEIANSRLSEKDKIEASDQECKIPLFVATEVIAANLIVPNFDGIDVVVLLGAFSKVPAENLKTFTELYQKKFIHNPVIRYLRPAAAGAHIIHVTRSEKDNQPESQPLAKRQRLIVTSESPEPISSTSSNQANASSTSTASSTAMNAGQQNIGNLSYFDDVQRTVTAIAYMFKTHKNQDDDIKRLEAALIKFREVVQQHQGFNFFKEPALSDIGALISTVRFRHFYIPEINAIIKRIISRNTDERIAMDSIVNNPSLIDLQNQIARLEAYLKENKKTQDLLDRVIREKEQLATSIEKLSTEKNLLEENAKKLQEQIRQLTSDLITQSQSSSESSVTSTVDRTQELNAERQRLRAACQALQATASQLKGELSLKRKLNEETKANCQQEIAAIEAECEEKIAIRKGECAVRVGEAEVKAGEEKKRLFAVATRHLTIFPNQSAETPATHSTASPSFSNSTDKS